MCHNEDQLHLSERKAIEGFQREDCNLPCFPRVCLVTVRKRDHRDTRETRKQGKKISATFQASAHGSHTGVEAEVRGF